MARKTDRSVSPGQAVRTTLGALVEAEPALARLLQLRLPVKAAYHLAKLGALTRAETAHFHEQRMKWIKELGVEREQTAEERAQSGSAEKVVAVKPEHVADFQARIAELTAIEVTLAWRPLPLASLDGQEIAGADLLALGPLVAEEAA